MNFADKQELLKYNNTKRIYEEEKTIPELFEEQVLNFKDKIAAEYRDDKITYGELNRKANQLARLLREKGVKPNGIVGIMVKRSIDMLIGIMGILKAGGCYLPIDPKFPQSRIDYMLEDSKATLLISQADLENSIHVNMEVIYMDEKIYEGDGENLPSVNKSTDMSYVIYTSGSTGKPKGVMLTHKGVHNFICGVIDRIDFNPNKTIASLTTISFDIFVLESLLPLTKGLTIVIADPMTFAKDAQGKKIEMIQTTPSTMKLIMKDKENLKYLDNLTDIMLGGEPFPKPLLEEIQEKVTAKIYNMYGPTETTVWSMIKELTNESEITIGYPIANTQIAIVDKNYNPVPFGQEGEICIAGDGVARGYLYREELTQERFICDIFADGKKMYRTGDLGKYLENGEIKFLGRIDSQVKVRGFRIELDEIQNVMSKMADIKECVISTKKNQRDEKYLIGYYIADNEIAVTNIIGFLKETLPDYMIPGIYMKIDKIPLTPNGKVNHLELPVPERKRPNLLNAFEEPKSTMEKELASIWSDELNIDEIGINDNFFDLGGNSILVAQVYAVLVKKYEQLEIADLFSYPTINKLCQYIEKNDRNRKVIILDNNFYQKEELKFECIKSSYTIEAPILQKIRNYLGQKDVNLFVTAIYLYLLSDNMMNSKISAFCGISDKMQSISCDFTELDDLEKIVDLVIEQYEDQKDLLTLTEIREQSFTDSQGVVLTILFGENEKVHIQENEIHVVLTVEEDMQISVYYNAGKLMESEINLFFGGVVNFIISLSEEM